MSGIRAQQDAALGRGDVSQSVLLVVETFAELGWEAENRDASDSGWESQQPIE